MARPSGTNKPAWTGSLRVWIGGHDRAARRALEPSLIGAVRPPTGALEAVFVTPASIDEALYFAGKSAPRLVADGHVWIVFATAPGASDGAQITESELTEVFVQHGFVPDGRSEFDEAHVALAFRCERTEDRDPIDPV